MRKLVMIALFLAACGSKKKEKEPVASCNMPALHSCQQYGKDNLVMGTKMLEELCNAVPSEGLSFTETACPTEKVIGRCVANEGTDVFYEGYELGDPAGDCERRQGKYLKR